MSKDSVIVDIRVPDTIDLVLLQTLKAANAIRDANRRREEQTRYREAVKIEEPDDPGDIINATNSVHPSTSTADQEPSESEDLISYAMRMMRTSTGDPNYNKHMIKKRLDFQIKNEKKPIKQSVFAKNALVEANREYAAEKNSRTDTHFRRSSAQKYFPDKRRTHTTFDNSLLHNLKNPLVAALYHGNTEDLFGYINNCPQSGMRMPDRNKCLCLTSFTQAQDNGILMALSAHIHQKECDQSGNCGRVSCSNGKDYMELIRRLFKETNRNYHMKEIVLAWLGSSLLYSQLCPLSYCLYLGAPELFNEIVDLIIDSDIEVKDFQLVMSRSRSHREVLEEALVYGVMPKLSNLIPDWRTVILPTYFDRVCKSGRVEAVLFCLSIQRDPDSELKTVWKYIFSLDYPKYLDILLKPTANNNILGIMERACLEGAEKCLLAMKKNEFWISELLDPNLSKYRTGIFEALLKVTRIYDRDLFNPVKDLVICSQEFTNFPFSQNVPDLFFHLACSKLWGEFSEWLKRLEGTKRNNQKYARSQDYLNLTFRYFVFSTCFNEKVLRVILDTLIAAGAYVQTDENDYAFLNELKRKDLQSYLKYKECSMSRYILDLEKEMEKLNVSKSSMIHGARRTPFDSTFSQPGAPSLKKPRLF